MRAARNGERRRPTIFVGGHQIGDELAQSGSSPPERSRRRYCGSAPVSSRPSEHRAEGVRHERCAREHRERLGGGDRLLGRDATLLDREARDVARREDGFGALDAAVLVGVDEPLERLRDAVDALAAQARQRDDALCRERVAGEEDEVAVDVLDRIGPAQERNAGFVEQRADGVARALAEQLERLELRRHDPHLDPVLPGRLEVGRSHQRELVGGQRPGRAPRHGERERGDLATVELGEQRTHPVAVGGATERQRAGDRRVRHRAAGDEQRVVPEDGARLRAGLAAVDVDCRERAERQARAEARRELSQVEMPHGAEAERLGHGYRAVPEARLGREELHADKALAELAQGQRRLQRRDAAARDHHREAVVRHVPIVRERAPGRHRGIGVLALGFLRIARGADSERATEHARCPPPWNHDFTVCCQP